VVEYSEMVLSRVNEKKGGAQKVCGLGTVRPRPPKKMLRGREE